MKNNIIYQAQTAVYLHLLQIAKHHPSANEWLAKLPSWFFAIQDKRRYAHAPFYISAVEKLPKLNNSQTNLADKVEVLGQWNEGEFKKAVSLLKNLMPWRKGPFFIGNGQDKHIHIDTEWRSDFKWDRVSAYLDLAGKHILDVGGGSGYHGFRMAGAKAKSVIVIDPSCLFYHQFMAIKHFTDDHLVHYLPVALEDLPESGWFDVVFSMGVLYHRASPFEHLEQLKNQLKKGGTLVLETLVVEGDNQTVLVPTDRYAQMNNVYFLPSVAALSVWLAKVGFHNIRCVDIDQTSTQEQRATDWMTYHSLVDFLDENNPNLTKEGYPAPRRAVILATK